MASVELESVSKAYSENSRVRDYRAPSKSLKQGETTDGSESAVAESWAVRDFSLEIRDREFLVLVGPSGCGKSTTLRLVAGLEHPTLGVIRIDGRVVNSTPPKDRDIAMVFQNYALYPHMSVYQNLSFGLELRFGGSFGARVLRRLINPRRAAELSAQRQGIDARVRQAAQRLGIEGLLNRKPHQLSGGERQRVALGRAIVRNPAAFLFDEPLSNLDAKLRQQMRGELKQLHQNLSSTMIYVTHDQVEAMTLGSRVAVMDRGRLQQVADPQTIYRRPANLFVARFFGSVPINLVAGKVSKIDGGWVFKGGSLSCPLNSGLIAENIEEWPEQVTLGVRPEDLAITDQDSSEFLWGFAATVTGMDHWGDAVILRLTPPWTSPVNRGNVDEEWHVKLPRGDGVKVGQSLKVGVPSDRVIWFDTATEVSLLKQNNLET